jgi:hypothetical protein
MAAGGKKFDSPQVLLSEQAQQSLRAGLDKLGAMIGTPGDQLFTSFMDAVRLSLEQAITSLFLMAAILGVIGFVVVLFLREEPLRRTHMTFADEELMASESVAYGTGGETPAGAAGEIEAPAPDDEAVPET